MRQLLPESAGEPLYVNDIQRVIQPGGEFDCPLYVPGCVILDPPAEDPPDGDGSAKAGADKTSGDGNSAPAGAAAKPARSK